MIEFRRNVIVVGILALVVAGALLLVRQFWPRPPEPDAEVKRQRIEDSVHAAAALAEADRLRGVVDSVSQALEDTAAAHRKQEQRLLGSANRLRDSIAVLEAQAVHLGLDSSGHPITVTDSTALAASCSVRYRLRTAEADSLRGALDECDRKASADSTRAAIVSDSLSTAVGRLTIALRQSDSARRAEIARPRPCTRNLLVAHPPCHVVDLVIAGVTFTGGVLVGRGSQ